jgi:hypothetical protein
MGQFGPKKHSKARGELSEAMIIARLLEAGYGVLTPFGDSSRYDLVIEDADGQFWRIQCKMAWMKSNDTLIFNTSSNHYHYGNKEQKSVNRRRDYRGQIDYFAAYSPDTGKVYLIPIDHVGTTSAALRLIPPKHSNQWGYKMAVDYEI